MNKYSLYWMEAESLSFSDPCEYINALGNGVQKCYAPGQDVGVSHLA